MWSLARSLPLRGRSPSRGAHGAAACGAALAPLAPAWSCRRARGGVTLGRRFPRRQLALSARDGQLAVSACGRQHGRVTFCDVCGSPATSQERVLSVAASCSLRELPRLRARASRIADPPARARSAAPPPPMAPQWGLRPAGSSGALGRRLVGSALPP